MACPTAAPAEVLVLSGVVTTPTTVTDLVDAHGGVPLHVVDVLSGGELATGCTYYDGSYQVMMPLAVGRRPALVCVDLLTDDLLTPISLTLEAPIELDPAQRTQTRDVGVSSTVWVALLANLAGQKGGDWENLKFGSVTQKLGGEIEGSEPAAEKALELVVFPDIVRATTAVELKDAITTSADVLTK